ncbi:hypothetical protein EQG49_04400 [Periweissella cryptocerci]|uniref:Lipoprotein n=1 Tax=Periweissella cryptocerci TaxID=2506420 RepID=A0A4P6YSW4_9LACO|nr:hypothetical protein [Periweissella cryptocerci]QBO35756.1 hypothetical protein EQG49_04400 [Periweissella cryptocerci]
MKKVLIGSFVLLASVMLVACGSSSNNANNAKSSSALEASKDSSSSKSDDSTDTLKSLNELAERGESTKELYVTGKMKVGTDDTIKPGIYDLVIKGGDGNIMGDRADVDALDINWIGGVQGNEGGDDSTFRVILFQGDDLDFSSISKVQFTAIKDAKESDRLGQGEYVVGRDIAAGTYKLSTNTKLDPEYDNLGWHISTYDDNTADTQTVDLTPGSSDVAVELTDGEIVTTAYDGDTGDSGSADKTKLIFTPVNQK